MTAAYLTIRAATALVDQASTGRSRAAIQAALKALPALKEGARFKVHRLDVEKAISELKQRPTVEPVKGVKPLSARHRTIARATHTTNAIINRLTARAASR